MSGFLSGMVLVVSLFIIGEIRQTQELLKDRTLESLSEDVEKLKEQNKWLFSIIQTKHPGVCAEEGKDVKMDSDGSESRPKYQGAENTGLPHDSSGC